MKKNIITLIPARMGSSRFPGKPLALIQGKPMIGHVFERVANNPLVSLTAVATCDQEIADYITSIGGTAVMTSDRHERAADRCAEALKLIEQQTGQHVDIVVMVQGDEPMTHPDMITEAVEPMLSDSSIKVTNLIAPIESTVEFDDRNCIKVVCDLAGNALYFSREPIPTRYKTSSIPMGKQVCVIPFTREYLIEYLELAPTPLEIAESVDMMRILEHGSKVRMIPTKFKTHSVDTEEDLRAVEKMMSAASFK